MLLRPLVQSLSQARVSILTRPEGRVLRLLARQRPRVVPVSILTRPEGRVLLPLTDDYLLAVEVSILTRPEGRVLRSAHVSATRSGVFQSSPGPKAECYRPGEARVGVGVGVSILTRPEGRVLRVVQARPQAGERVSILTRPEGRVLRGVQEAGTLTIRSFNPHPARRPSATTLGGPDVATAHWFQSSPGPKAECYGSRCL